MFQYDYSVCGVKLHLEADAEMKIEDHSRLFLCGPGQPDLRITLQSVPEIETPGGQFCGRNAERLVWRDGPLVSRCCQDLFRPRMHFRADYRPDRPGPVDCTVRADDWSWATRSQYLWPGIMVNYLLLPFRTLIFHASYIGVGGQGILFTAPSGTGKSTQAELWRVHRGARVLNGDKAGVTLRETPMVHGVPFSGTSGICENVSLPLRAIVTLSQAPENTVRRLGPTEAVAALCPNLFVDSFVPEEWQTALHLLLDLITIVPVYALACTPDERAVQTLEQVLG